MTDRALTLREICQDLAIRDDAGDWVVNSRELAKRFGKRHDNVLRDIERLCGSSNLRDLENQWFKQVQEFDPLANKMVRSYDCTDLGAPLLICRWEGEKALAFQVRYHQAFKWLREHRQRQQLSSTISEAVALALEQQVVPAITHALQAKPYREMIGGIAKAVTGTAVQSRIDPLFDRIDALEKRLDPGPGYVKVLELLIENGCEQHGRKGVAKKISSRLRKLIPDQSTWRKRGNAWAYPAEPARAYMQLHGRAIVLAHNASVRGQKELPNLHLVVDG